jgi:hypothetical protein
MPTKTKRNNKRVIKKKRRNTKKGGDFLGNWVYLTVAIQNSFNRLIEGFKSILNSLKMGVFAIYEYICFIITDIYKVWDSPIFVLIVIVLGVFSFGLAIPALSFSNIPNLCSILLGLWSVIITTFSVGGPALLSMIWTHHGLTGLSWLLITGASLFGIDLLLKWRNDDLDDISEITKEREVGDINELIQTKSVELIALQSEYDALDVIKNAPNKNERMRVIKEDIDKITVDIASAKKTQTELQTWLRDKYDEKRAQEKRDTALKTVDTIKQKIKDMRIRLKTLSVNTEIEALDREITSENNSLDIAMKKYMDALKEVETRKASSKLKIHVTTREEMMRLLDTLGGNAKYAIMKYQIHVLQKMISDSDRTINRLVFKTKLDHKAPDESIIKELYAKYSYIEKSETFQLELYKIVLTEEEEKELNEIHKKLISIIKEPYTIETLHFYSDVEHEPQHTKLEPVTIKNIKELIVKNVSSVSVKNFSMSCPIGALSCLSHESIESLAKEYLQLEKKSRPDVEREFLHAKDIVEKQSFLRMKSDEDTELILAKFRYNIMVKVSASADKKVESLKGGFTITSLEKIIGAIWSKTYITIKLDGLKKIVEDTIDTLTEAEQEEINDSVEHLEENFPKDPTYLDYEKYQEKGYIDETIKKTTGSDSIHEYEFAAVKSCLKTKASNCSYITDDNREQMETVLAELTQFKTDLGWRSHLYFGGGGVGVGGVKKPLSEKIHNLSTKKLLEMFTSIPKENIENLKQKNPVQFYIATVIGFIKETETGFEFTEEGIKGLKSVLKQSVDKVDKHCPKGKVCNTSMKNNEPKKKHNKSEKSTEVLTYEDTLELKGLLSSLEFVNMASMHSIVRENTNDIKMGGGSKGKKSKGTTNTTKTLGYLEKDDIEWLKEKHPKKYEAAKKYGFITTTGELAPICSKIIEDNSNINGIDINKEFEKGVSESQKDKIMNCILEDKQRNKEECRLFKERGY